MITSNDLRNKGRMVPVNTKTERPREPETAPVKPKSSYVAPIQACVLCGEPCRVSQAAREPGWEIQDCPYCGHNKRRATVAKERLG